MNRRFAVLLVLPLLTFPAICFAQTTRPAVTIRPYLQRPTHTGISILWATNTPVACVLRYGEGGVLDKSAEVGEPQPCKHAHLRKGQEDPRGLSKKRDYIYTVRLAGLKAGTAYRYEVIAGGARETGSFRTIPRKLDRFRFIAYGDSRSGTHIHRKIASQLNRHKPDFILHSGDMVGSGHYYEWPGQFFTPLADVLAKVPIWPARGNHESNGTVWRRLFDLPGDELNYTFTYGNAEFFILYSRYEKGEREKVLAWLTPKLAASKARWKIAMYHHPTYDRGKHNTRWGREDIAPVFRKFGVDVVIMAHSHSQQRFRPMYTKGENEKHPVTYIVSAGGGAPLGIIGRSHYHAWAAGKYGYSVVDIAGDVLSWKTFDQDGRRLDEFAIRKPGGEYDPAYLALAMDEAEFGKYPAMLFKQLIRHVLNGMPNATRPVTATFEIGAGEEAMDFRIQLAPYSRRYYHVKPVIGRSEAGKKALVTVSVLVRKGEVESDEAGRLTPYLDLFMEYEIGGKRGSLKGGRLYVPIAATRPGKQDEGTTDEHR